MSAARETTTRQGPPSLDDAFDAELERMALAESQPLLEEPAHGHGLARYLRFKIQDFLKYRATILLPIALLGLWMFRDNYDPSWLERAARHRGEGYVPTEAMWFRSLVMQLSIMFGGFGSLVSVYGIVSREREGGYQRFLFAKPIRIVSYYLQTLVVNGIGLLATSAVVLALTSLVFLRPVPIAEAMVAIAAVFAAVGGLTFLLSTLVRFEFAAAAVLAMLAFPLHAAAQRGYWWAILTSWMLPPMHLLGAFEPRSVGPDKPTVVSAVGSLVTYGAAYLAIGIGVLKRRSIIR